MLLISDTIQIIKLKPQFLFDLPVFFLQNKTKEELIMGKHKKRSPNEKLEIVLEAIQSENISKTCRKYGIYENQFYQWKDRLLESADKIYRNRKKKDPEKENLKDENKRLKKTIVEQSCELQILKKNDK